MLLILVRIKCTTTQQFGSLFNVKICLDTKYATYIISKEVVISRLKLGRQTDQGQVSLISLYNERESRTTLIFGDAVLKIMTGFEHLKMPLKEVVG